MSQIRSATPGEQVLSYRFVYGGVSRIVDNVVIRGSYLEGFELRRAGKFSNKIKRYALDQLTGPLERIVVDRPNRPEAPTEDYILVDETNERLTVGRALSEAL